jgi:hypothetical protein
LERTKPGFIRSSTARPPGRRTLAISRQHARVAELAEVAEGREQVDERVEARAGEGQFARVGAHETAGEEPLRAGQRARCGEQVGGQVEAEDVDARLAKSSVWRPKPQHKIERAAAHAVLDEPAHLGPGGLEIAVRVDRAVVVAERLLEPGLRHGRESSMRMPRSPRRAGALATT